MKKGFIYIVAIQICFLIACDNIGTYPKKVLKDKEVFIKQFHNISLMRSRGLNTIILYTYEGKDKNQFFFDVSTEGNYTLTPNSKKFNRSLLSNHPAYEKQLTSSIKNKIWLMDIYQIRDISHEFRNQGIDMIIYFNSSESLFFIKNIKDVKNAEWQNDIKKMRKLDEHWFYKAEQS